MAGYVHVKTHFNQGWNYSSVKMHITVYEIPLGREMLWVTVGCIEAERTHAAKITQKHHIMCVKTGWTPFPVRCLKTRQAVLKLSTNVKEVTETLSLSKKKCNKYTYCVGCKQAAINYQRYFIIRSPLGVYDFRIFVFSGCVVIPLAALSVRTTKGSPSLMGNQWPPNQCLI